MQTTLQNKPVIRLENLTKKEIALFIGSTRGAVAKAMIDLDIPSRQQFREYPVDWIREQYLEKGKTTIEIANELGCDPSLISRLFKKVGIPARTSSEVSKGRIVSEKTREKMSIVREGKGFGPENPNWRGGSAFYPYCYKYNESLKEKIRNQYHRKCFVCGKHEDEQNRRLAVHHVDGNPMQGCDGSGFLLVPLCNSCHGKMQGEKKDFWCWAITFTLSVLHR